MNTFSILWAMVVFAHSMGHDHSITIPYEKIANKNVTFKVVWFVKDDNPQDVLSEIIEADEDRHVEDFIKSKYSSAKIIEIQTLNISESHDEYGMNFHKE